MVNDTKMILDKLDELKSKIDSIQSHLVNVDAVLTDDDVTAIKEAEEDYKKGKTVRL